jgi:hypothetical protein
VVETTKRSPIFRFVTTAFGANGMTIQMTAAGMNIAIGAARKTQKSARPGATFSLVKSFITSAAGCKIPRNPVLLGP